jgi:mannose-1-phosphate guanylyltransferase
VTSLKPIDIAGFAHRWGIILSGGNGMRLRDLIYRRRADYLPKQYMNFIGKRSMLEHTLDRAEKLIPAQRLLTVITKEHLKFDEARHQVASRPPERVIIQPENRDTGPGILLPVICIYQRDPDTVVALFPSDHFILEEDVFMRHVSHAFRLVESNAFRIVLLGLEPRGPDPEYGYIIPGRHIDGSTREVEMFVEKPSVEAAQKIIGRGALWNTMVMVFGCKTFLSVIQRVAPELYSFFAPILHAAATSDEERVIKQVYQKIPSLNFSKEIIERLPFDHHHALLIHPVRGVTWSDWGTSDRLVSTLRQLGAPDLITLETVTSERRVLRIPSER